LKLTGGKQSKKEELSFPVRYNEIYKIIMVKAFRKILFLLMDCILMDYNNIVL